MTNLPESIWADEGDDRVEYVRADIVTARIAAESEPQWQDGYNSARDDLDAESAHISAREAKLAEIDAHRRKVIAENERQMNALIESSRRIAALEAQLAERVKVEGLHVAYFDDGQFHWISGIAPRNCELYALEATPPAPKGQPVTLTYKNWRGEVSERTITPKRVWFGSTDWHPEPQWLVTAFDGDKQADRDFALADFGATPPSPKVTDEMVEAASHEYMRIFGKHLQSEHAQAILTAAQEAGKP